MGRIPSVYGAFGNWEVLLFDSLYRFRTGPRPCSPAPFVGRIARGVCRGPGRGRICPYKAPRFDSAGLQAILRGMIRVSLAAPVRSLAQSHRGANASVNVNASRREPGPGGLFSGRPRARKSVGDFFGFQDNASCPPLVRLLLQFALTQHCLRERIDDGITY